MIDHGVGVGAHLAGSYRVIHRLRVGPQVLGQLGVGLDLGPGKQFTLEVLPERRFAEDSTNDAYPLDQRLDVPLIG